MTSSKVDLLHNIGGVYTATLCGDTYAALSWGSGFAAGLQRLELIADDHAYSFKTVEQKFDFTDKRPYGPQQGKNT